VVQHKGPAESITVEDSFKDCSSLPAAQQVISVLAPDLLARLVKTTKCVLGHAVFSLQIVSKQLVSLVNLSAGVLIRLFELSVFVLYDFRSLVALSAAVTQSALSFFQHADDVTKGLVSLPACVLVTKADLSSRFGLLWVQINQSWRWVAQPSPATLTPKI